MKKKISAKIVTTSCGESPERQQIIFDETSGLIEQVGQLGVPDEEIDYHYGDECLLFGAFGDVHIHAREDVSGKHLYKEDYLTASQAALNGGVLHTCDMPNNPIAPVDQESYLAKLQLTQKGLIPIIPYGGITSESMPLEMEVPYKVYMGPSVGDLDFKTNEEVARALVKYKNQWVSFHCEDVDVLRDCAGEPDHYQRRPVRAEVIATKQALEWIEQFELKGKLCHYSSGEGLDHILKAKANGVHVTCEVTPQHLFFSQESLSPDQLHLMQMNPPIRKEQDRARMLAAFRKGEIDFLATDHAPHTWEEKEKGTSGLTGLDTYGAFVCWLIVEQKVSLQVINQACVINPAQFVNPFMQALSKHAPWLGGHGKGIGRLEPGYSASFTILNLQQSKKITKQDLRTKVGWSPFEGVTFPGQVQDVFLLGKQILIS